MRLGRSAEGRENPQTRLKFSYLLPITQLQGSMARGTGMTIDLKRLLKKCRKQITGGLNFTPTSAETAPVAGPRSTHPRWQKQMLNGTPFARLRAGSEDTSLEHARWDLFFTSLLNPQAVPRPDRTQRAGSNGQDMSADAEAVMHLFTWSAAVQTLKAQLDKVPDIRQQRVDSLKQAMAEGRYQLYPQQIAAAMFAEGGLNLD